MAIVKTRRSRRQSRGRFKLHVPHWVDPFPSIEGTEPEKRVFSALYNRKLYFIYQGQIPEFEVGGKMFFAAPPNYKPDFILPEYKLIIDPFSPFHHSLKGADERDRDKIARYAAAGYAYYHPWAIGPGIWSWDQRHNYVNPDRNKRYGKIDRKVTKAPRMGTHDMLASIPELLLGPRYPLIDPLDVQAKARDGYRIGENLGAGANSVAATNARRRVQRALGFNTGSRRTLRRGTLS